VLGWLFALSATRMLATWSGIETGLSPDRSVLLFTLLVSALAALAFGLVPLWSAMRAPVAGVLRATSANATTNRGRVLGGRIVLAGQMAICLVLLMAAGLLLRTLRNYATQNLGMQAEGLLVFNVLRRGRPILTSFIARCSIACASFPAWSPFRWPNASRLRMVQQQRRV
jgi:hypothetical protein